MKSILSFVLIASLACCAHAASFQNDRPMKIYTPAHELIPQCKIAVQFNENEASVPESKYLDGMFCLGLMEGIFGANSHLSSTKPMFCPPDPGIKTWIAAKAIVDYATKHPELLDLDEAEFSINALAAKYPCLER